jgi:hypothetical protein
VKITNDHHKVQPAVWQHDNERVVYVTDDNGCTWEFRSASGGGIQVRTLGTGCADDQISAHGRAGNMLVLRSGAPE